MTQSPEALAGFRAFADGACSGNPGRGGWGAIVATPSGRVVELGGSEDKSTNNRMELEAACRVLEFCRHEGGQVHVTLHTDSTYVIQGITGWIHGWKKRQWIKTDGAAVTNRELWERLDSLASHFSRRLDWVHVHGHVGVEGNERADEIAVEFSQGRSPSLYNGPLVKYPVDLMAVEADSEALAQKKKAKAKRAPKGPGIYLSLVNGELKRHATWPECQARVNGVAGARFKKVTNEAEERETLKSWGLRS